MDPRTIELVILVGFQVVIFVVQFESRDLNFCIAGGLSNLGHEVKSHENLFLGPFGDCTQIASHENYWLYNLLKWYSLFSHWPWSTRGIWLLSHQWLYWPPEVLDVVGHWVLAYWATGQL